MSIESIIGKAVETAGGTISADNGDAPEVAASDANPVADTSVTDPVETADASASADPEAVVAADPVETKTEEPDVPDLTAAELSGATIPVHRHKAVLTKARKEKEAIQAELATFKSEETQQKLKAIEIADSNPELFAKVLLEDPKFKAILEKHFVPAAVPASGKEPVAPAEPDVELPQPDVLLPDGNAGYSAGAAERLLQYHIAKANKEADAKFTKAMDERFGKLDPLLKTHEAQVEYTKRLEEQKSVVAEAERTWPKFADYKKEIREYLAKPENAKATLEQAYRSVVIPKLQADRDKMRVELLAELKSKPAAAIGGPKPQSANPVAAKRSIEDIIREKVASVSA